MINENILAVIPARAGSKGVKGKNLKLLCGKPLIAYMIGYALTSKYISRTVLSTDSAEVPFLRPKELAKDTSPLKPVLKNVLYHYDAQGWYAEVVISLQPTSPLISSSIIDGAIELLYKAGCVCASVSEIKHGHPYRAKSLGTDLKLEHFYKEFDGKKF